MRKEKETRKKEKGQRFRDERSASEKARHGRLEGKKRAMGEKNRGPHA